MQSKTCSSTRLKHPEALIAEAVDHKLGDCRVRIFLPQALGIAVDLFGILRSRLKFCNTRPEFPEFGIGKILELMQAEAGRQFDPVVAKALCEVIAQDQRKAA